MITGTASVDNLIGSDLDDIIYGLGWWDELDGRDGNDKLYGGEQDDRLQGGAGNDHLDGGNGDDDLADFEGNNVLEGGAGDDYMQSGNGNSVMRGGDGNDDMEAYGGGKVEAFGGVGNDRFHLGDYRNYGEVFAWGEAGDDRFEFHANDWQMVKITVSGGAGSDTFAPYYKDNYAHSPQVVADFKPGAGGDMLDVSGLIDFFWTAGNPFGLAGQVRLVQRGADTVLQHLQEGREGLRVFLDALTLQNVNLGQLTVDNIAGRHTPFLPTAAAPAPQQGGALNDTLTEGRQDDVLNGGNGDDRLDGASGNDRLFGEFGNTEYLG